MHFEQGAEEFEARATVPDEALAPLPTLLRSLGVPAGGVWLDVGAGTGQLARTLRSEAQTYLALDRSPAMLTELCRRLGSGVHALLADADDPWPLVPGGVATVCLFRVAHLLEPRHLVRELRRCCAQGAHVLWLRRHRDTDSFRERLRTEMRARVARLRGEPLQSVGARHTLREALGAPVARVEVSQWQSQRTLAQMLDAWGGKDGLAGGPIEAHVKGQLLADLRRWAELELGDLYSIRRCDERLSLDIFRIE